MKKLLFLAVIILFIISCNKDDDQSSTLDQATIEQNLEGRWIGTLELEVPGSLGVWYNYVDYDITLAELTLGEKAGDGIVSWSGGNNCQVDWHYTAFSGKRATFTETSPCWEDFTAYVWFKEEDDLNTISVLMPDLVFTERSWLGNLERQ